MHNSLCLYIIPICCRCQEQIMHFCIFYVIMLFILIKEEFNVGDGSKLKQILDDKNMTITRLAKETGMNQQTLYSIVKRDSYIRYDFALRIANVLEIDVNDICEDNPYKEIEVGDKEILPSFPTELSGILDNNRLKRYVTGQMLPLFSFFGIDKMPEVDRHLVNYYRLTDEARHELDQYLEFMLQSKEDPEHANNIKSIKDFKAPKNKK